MTEPNGWLDMSAFGDQDPDTVLTTDQHGLLTTALAVDDGDLPDAVWEHMLATVVGGDDTGSLDAEDPVDAGVEADPDVDTIWSDDLEHSFAADGAEGSDGTDPVDEHHEAGDPGHTGEADGAL